ncbi:AmpG family muropeptide MFS transporter [Alteromonas lipotrueiana]|uniref:AmpG family muropeptide MFS transporter n=1 Tax=Alteromonas lipotrueiana TaxID=2803815 RepID=UPI001C457AA1|nr:MFS transporter [Alteromonas lipotrueiana]
MSFPQFIHAYRDRRLLSIFLFGISSGFPFVMIGSVMAAWLSDAGIQRASIGLFGIVFSVYAVNFLWSPLLDRIRIPFLGQRRGWIVTMQLAIAGCCFGLSTLNIQGSIYTVALLSLIIAILSATQDIAIDAYRIDIIADNEKDKLSAGSSLATAGWWTGYGGLGAVPFVVADLPGWNWPDIYLLLAAIMLIIAVFTLLAKEPQVDRSTMLHEAESRYAHAMQGSHSKVRSIMAWLGVTLVEPFKEFFSRNGLRLAISILAFVFLFKIGEAFLGRMSIVFYKEVGFTNTDIGYYSKLLNWWVTIVFSLLGGIMNIRYGIYRGLFIAGIAMASSNLMFAWIAEVGPDKTLFAAAIVVDGFTSAWGTVAMVAFISLMCNRTFSASQYALMASLSVAGKNTLASSGGWVVDILNGNWSLFFVLTAVMVIPGLLLLRTLRTDIAQAESTSRTM